MTAPVARLSARPEFVVDAWSFKLYDPVSKTCVGRDGSRSRERVVSALPHNGGPQWVERPRIVNDAWGFALADPQGNIIGKPGIVVHRLLRARWVEDTRRLGG